MAQPYVVGGGTGTEEVVTERLHEARLRICAACPLRNPGNRVVPATCSVCHCVLWVKTRLKGQSCPQGKW